MQKLITASRKSDMVMSVIQNSQSKDLIITNVNIEAAKFFAAN